MLIPARNEEQAIGAAVEAVLASEGVHLEVIVLDDHSTDGTAAVVAELAKKDSRVRLEHAPVLPPGWCGKQFACATLAGHARYPILTFLDADVRLTPHALVRMAGFLASSGAGLVSGFPRQETGTLLEKLVIPLINWLLLCYLPLAQMRASRQVGLGAGCGQWFMTTCDAYEAIGGHEKVKASLHDGVKLPRAYRAAGYATDICDVTDLAVCRMYRSAGQVWFGLAKNAREGLAAPLLIWVWTGLLFCGHVLPFILFAFAGEMEMWQVAVTAAAIVLSYAPRLAVAERFRASWVGALLHPLGVTLLLAIQWYATVRAWVGKPVGWKGRAYPG
ncbi:Glycosyl transferase, family 2 [Fimbriiglobus ruber]|uniref:Glycosyl transferase, family 2 n=1 Tax=Fimbriiglobus ruber TaxID=1908690 RepID=A0A225DF77_9BACT|nr:Glycosyl transferase, family 2 [Fimbriiglobus ruber]